jgi:biotin carboxylase
VGKKKRRERDHRREAEPKRKTRRKHGRRAEARASTAARLPAGSATAKRLGAAKPKGSRLKDSKADRHGHRRLPARPILRGISEIRAFLRTNRTPIHFISPTPFNLLGIDRWVRDFFYVSYYDCFEGSHPRIFVPRERPWREFASIEEINDYLLGHKEVIDFVASKGDRGLAVFVMFDEEAERLAPELGLRIAHPPAALRRHIDSKTVTTRLAAEAGVPSVPNTLARVGSYQELMAAAAGADLGDDLVVQTPYGDSGRTTFFIHGERDWAKAAKAITAEAEVKVMRRVNVKAAAIEATITRHGTIVGPLMTDLTGYRELTPYKGGWCGNDMWPEVFSEHHRRKSRKLVQRLGRRLAQEGYVGFFEVDVLVDADSDRLYLGEINPRVSGASSMTNATAGAYADLPLFAFHLLEYLDVDYEVDVEGINHRWAQAETIDVWSQLIVKEPNATVEQLTAAPRTGIWRMEPDGSIHFGRWGNDWHSIIDETEAFWLRVLPPGDYRYKGADLGVLVSRQRMQTDELTLTPECRRWIAGIRAQYAGLPIEPAVAPLPRREPFAFKFG